MADLSLEFSRTGFWDTVIRAFFKQAPLSADVHVSQVLHRGNTIYTTDRKGRGADSWPQRWQPKHIWRIEICKIIRFRQRQKIFFPTVFMKEHFCPLAVVLLSGHSYNRDVRGPRLFGPAEPAVDPIWHSRCEARKFLKMSCWDIISGAARMVVWV